MTRIANTEAKQSPKNQKQKTHRWDISSVATKVAWVYLAILGLLPLHAFLSTWAGSSFGHIDAWRIWKEVVIVLTIPAVGYIVARDKMLRLVLLHQWLFRLMYAYIALYIGSGIMALLQGNVNAAALTYALFANLRFLGFFMLVLIVARYSTVLQRYVVRVVVGVSAFVAAFGLAQKMVLPYDFLKHFGYSQKTIPAYQTVDNKLSYIRIQSTLRGSNPLGAYLVLILSMISVYIRALHGKQRLVLGLLGSVALISLFFSYSRSAYVGVAVALALIAVIVSRGRWRNILVIAAVGLLILGGGGVYVFRHNKTVENTLFHTDSTSTSATSSNAGRASAIKQALSDVVHEPVGRGPGTAGPESTRNRYPARIAENYYLQIGQEVGWLGMVLFILIIMLVGYELWQVRQSPLGLALFVSLVALTLINMASHAWSDDTLGLLWWGLAGVVLAERLPGFGSNNTTTK